MQIFTKKPTSNFITIGCFGATRPYKNQLEQAVGAIIAAKKLNKTLIYIINGSRIEYGGDGIILNIRALFKDNPKAKLIELSWLTHNKFLEIISTVDVNLQVSYSETFNIVSADSITAGVPVIVSSEIDWLPSAYYADPNDAFDIANKILFVLKFKRLVLWSQRQSLKLYNKRALKVWNSFLQP